MQKNVPFFDTCFTGEVEWFLAIKNPQELFGGGFF